MSGVAYRVLSSLTTLLSLQVSLPCRFLCHISGTVSREAREQNLKALRNKQRRIREPVAGKLREPIEGGRKRFRFHGSIQLQYRSVEVAKNDESIS